MFQISKRSTRTGHRLGTEGRINMAVCHPGVEDPKVPPVKIDASGVGTCAVRMGQLWYWHSCFFGANASVDCFCVNARAYDEQHFLKTLLLKAFVYRFV